MFAKPNAPSLPKSAKTLNYQLVWAMAGGLIRMQDKFRQRRHFAELDDRMLADIGIDRTTAMREANKPLWR